MSISHENIARPMHAILCRETLIVEPVKMTIKKKNTLDGTIVYLNTQQQGSMDSRGCHN